MEGLNNMKEPSTAPQAGRWYNLTLGSSFTDHQPSSRFCTLRYDFKPASIDKNQPGTLHKNKDHKVTVEFQNNQPGRPNVTFEGISEDHKENDAVLLFDGESMRLERLHHVKRLKYNRIRGESTVTTAPGISDASSPPIMKGMKHQSLNKEPFHAAPVEVERIDVGGFKRSDAKHRHEKPTEYPGPHANSPNVSPDLVDIMNEDDDENGNTTNVKEYETGNVEVREYETGNVEVKEYETENYKRYDTGIDINIPHQGYSDDETADVDVIDDEADNGPTAAQALIAQAAKKQDKESSSSSGSGSSSSSSSSESSGSGSSSGGGDSSDGDTVNSI